MKKIAIMLAAATAVATLTILDRVMGKDEEVSEAEQEFKAGMSEAANDIRDAVCAVSDSIVDTFSSIILSSIKIAVSVVYFLWMYAQYAYVFGKRFYRYVCSKFIDEERIVVDA